MRTLLFLFCFFVIIFSLGVVTSTNPIYSILSLILTFVFATFIFLILGLEFTAIIFLIVYVGAIAVLFLFVVMMLNIKVIELEDSFWRYLIVGLVVGTLLFFQVLYLIFPTYLTDLLRTLLSFRDNLFYVNKIEVYGDLPTINEAELEWQFEVYRYWSSVFTNPGLHIFGIQSNVPDWRTLLTSADFGSLSKQLGFSIKFDEARLAEMDFFNPQNRSIFSKLQSYSPRYDLCNSGMFDPSLYEFSSSGQISGLKYPPRSYCNQALSSVDSTTARRPDLLIASLLTFRVVDNDNNTDWFGLFFLDNTTWLGLMLYTYNFFVFMVISLILLMAMVGSIVLVLAQNINLKRQLIFKQVSKGLETSISLQKFKK